MEQLYTVSCFFVECICCSMRYDVGKAINKYYHHFCAMFPTIFISDIQFNWIIICIVLSYLIFAHLFVLFVILNTNIYQWVSWISFVFRCIFLGEQQNITYLIWISVKLAIGVWLFKWFRGRVGSPKPYEDFWK